jgi:hypothetical protein
MLFSFYFFVPMSESGLLIFIKIIYSRCWWLIAVILASREAEIGRITV